MKLIFTYKLFPLIKNFYFLFLLIFVSSCLPSGVYEKNYAFKHNQWNKEVKPSFAFNITDTTKNYKLYLYMRHTDAYPFSNIWLNIHTKMPKGMAPTTMKVEVPLADETGKWYAKGMNEIREHKMTLTGNGSVHFNAIGNYEIQLEQIMRMNPLPEVMSIGIILEKDK